MGFSQSELASMQPSKTIQLQVLNQLQFLEKQKLEEAK